MITIDMLQILCCPSCKTSELEAEIKEQKNDQIQEGELICRNCGISYSVAKGIAHLAAENMMVGEEWDIWRDHLLGLQERREERIENPERLLHRLGKGPNLKKKFSEFIGPIEGNVLDVGCGPGKFKRQLKGVNYFGLDPIVLPETAGFPFVHSMAEHIPFKNNTFSHIFAINVLDHLRDLDAFYKEVARVLDKKGQLHIVQHVHDVTGPITAFKYLAHEVKDKLEDKKTTVENPDTPKHITEFTTSSLDKSFGDYFNVVSTLNYSYKWYSPNKLFLTLAPN